MAPDIVMQSNQTKEVSMLTPDPYKRGDVRKLLRVALAASELETPTLNNLARATGMNKQVLIDDLKRLPQMGIVIEKDESSYRLVSWGPILNGADSIRAFLQLPPAGEQHD
jgi:hypothetical protein